MNGHAVHGIGRRLPVEVDAGRLVQVVLEDSADAVALRDPQQGAGPAAVEAERGDRCAHQVGPVADLVDGQLEDLGRAVQGVRERGVGDRLVQLRVLPAEEPVDGRLGVHVHLAPAGGDRGRRRPMRPGWPSRRSPRGWRTRRSRRWRSAWRRGHGRSRRWRRGSRLPDGVPLVAGVKVQAGASAGAQAATDAATRPPPARADARRKLRRLRPSSVGVLSSMCGQRAVRRGGPGGLFGPSCRDLG